MAKIAILLASDFEDSEYTVPVDRLEDEGHQITVLGADAGDELTGKNKKEVVTTDAQIDPSRASEFDALLIPGGYSPDHLRMESDAVEFVRRFNKTGKLIAAVCHGPQLLIEADVVKGRTLTSWPSIRTDLKNAGAKVVDREVCEDKNFITSRGPDDLEAFSEAIVHRLAQRKTTEREQRPVRAP